MELFKIFGTIGLNGVNEANNELSLLSGNASKSSNSITSAFKKIATAVGIGFGVHKIIQFGKSVISTTQSFSDAMLKVQSLSGASAEELEQLNETALKYGSTTAWTSSQVADAMGYMALAGFDTTEIMDSLGGVLSLASASGTDLAVTSDILTDSLTAFGYSAKDAGLFSNVLATTQAKSNTTVEMLGESFKYVGTLAGSYKYSIQDVSTALGLMANSGIKGSMAGTSLSAIITRLATDTNGARKTIEDLGIAFYNEDGTARALGEVITDLCVATENMTSQEKASIASKIAGQEAQKGLLAILNQGADVYNELNSTLKQCDGSADSMANTMESGVGGAIRSIQSAWEAFKIRLGQKIEAPIANLLHDLANFVNNNLVPAMLGLINTIENVIKWFNEHKLITESLITILEVLITKMIAFKAGAMIQGIINMWQMAQVTLALYTATTEGATIAQGFLNGQLTLGETIVGLLTGKITLAQFATALWTKAQAGLNAVMSANPIGVILVSIGALILLIVKLYTKCEWFRNGVNAIGNFLKNLVVKGVEGLKNLFNSIVNFFKNNWQSISTAIASPFVKAFNVIRDAFGKIGKFFNDLINNIKNAWSNFCNFLQNSIKLPHFKSEGSWNPFDWGSKGFPKIGVEWYADGGIMTRPTLFGYNQLTGNSMVGGEAGAEAIVPIDRLQGYVSTAVKNETSDLAYGINKLMDLLSTYLPEIKEALNRPIVLDSGKVVGGIASKMDNKLGDIMTTRARYGV